MSQADWLTLKPYTDRDEARMIALLTHDEIKKTFMLPDFATREDASAMFQRLKRLSEVKEHYERGVYLDGVLIGFVNDVEIESRQIELGYVIDPLYKNRGYATRALRIAIDELFGMGYRAICCGAFENNLASQRVMQKCGMQLTDRRERIEYRGQAYDCVYYLTQSQITPSK